MTVPTTVHIASPTHPAKRVPPLNIVGSKAWPDDVDTYVAAETDAQLLASALCDGLPGATLDRLTAELMLRMASRLRVPAPSRTPALACGATKPALRPYGWTCTGEDLVAVTTGPGGVPIVVPQERLAEAMAAPWAADVYEPELFPGGDHYHLGLTPRAKPAARVHHVDEQSGVTTCCGLWPGNVALTDSLTVLGSETTCRGES